MKITVDTREVKSYSPLIPAIKAICTARPGTTLEIYMNDPEAFKDLKTFLSEEGTGFREVYKADCNVLEFTLPQ